MEIRKGYKQTEIGVIPDDWKIYVLKKITSLIIDGTHFTPTYIKYGIPFLRVTDIQSTEINTLALKYIPREEHKKLIKRCNPQTGDLLLSKNGTIGIPKIVTWEWEFSLFVSLALIKPRAKELNVTFLYQLFKSSLIDKQIEQRSKQGAVTNLHLEEIREFLIPLPPQLKEQKAIATALSDMDALLEGLDQLIAKKRDIKQATMQQLLTGKTRLAGFEGEWKVKQLGEIVTFLDGQRKPVKSADRASIQGSIPYYGASGIVDYVNNYIFDEDLILLGEDGDNILSRNLPLAFRISGKTWVNNHAHVIRPNHNISIGFLVEYLESLCYKNLNSGTAQPKLNKQKCLAIPVILPTKKEQTAIANILTDMDTEIEALEKRRAKTLNLKQAMMQELLTGKTRLIDK